MLRARPPNVAGRGPLVAEPGFGVVVVSIVKDEATYLEEWIAFHAALGVDHFVVYDNGSTDGTAGLLERYQTHGLVTRLDWPLRGGQLAAYNHALRFFGGVADWLAYFDVDEFLVPLLDDDIPSFLGRFDEAAVVRVPRLEFGFSGHRRRPDGLGIDAYTQVANVLDLDADLPARVKSIVRPEAVSAVDIHLAFPADAPLTGAPTATVEAEVRGVAQLNHYYTRSFEEFEAKRVRGSATGRIDRPAVAFDVPTIETDEAARRFSERTRRSIEHLRRLEAQPYTYGSELRLAHFPKPNDLGRFAEFAIANMAAGLSEPQRSAALRLRNLHEGIGLAADLSATDYEPERDGLSASVHGQVLVEHMRGRIETRLSWRQPKAGLMVGQGSLDVPFGGPAELRLADGRAELLTDVPTDDMLRCWSLGFVVACARPTTVQLELIQADGSQSEPVTVSLPGSRCLAGVVEVAPRPVGARQVRIEVAGEAHRVDLFDLFSVSYG
jgi:hypothetical protein